LPPAREVAAKVFPSQVITEAHHTAPLVVQSDNKPGVTHEVLFSLSGPQQPCSYSDKEESRKRRLSVERLEEGEASGGGRGPKVLATCLSRGCRGREREVGAGRLSEYIWTLRVQCFFESRSLWY
jgi:hypothetical protein